MVRRGEQSESVKVRDRDEGKAAVMRGGWGEVAVL